MKVQRKNGTPTRQYEVVEETCKFYVVYGDILGSYTAYSKADYEPVQEWVDVTHECYASLIDNTYRIYHRVDGNGTWIGDQYGYRITNANDLSKIKVEKKA